MERDLYTDEEIKQVFSLKKIAVIGMSKHSAKAAHFVPKYLSEQGFDITPINPHATEIIGKRYYPDVSSLDHPVEVVDIFRPSEVPRAQREDQNDCLENFLAPNKDKRDYHMSFGVLRIPQKDQMDYWRQFLVSWDPKLLKSVSMAPIETL